MKNRNPPGGKPDGLEVDYRLGASQPDPSNSPAQNPVVKAAIHVNDVERLTKAAHDFRYPPKSSDDAKLVYLIELDDVDPPDEQPINPGAFPPQRT